VQRVGNPQEVFFHSTRAQSGGLLFGALSSILARVALTHPGKWVAMFQTGNANISLFCRSGDECAVCCKVKGGYIPGPPSRQNASTLDPVGDEVFVLLSQDHCVGVL